MPTQYALEWCDSNMHRNYPFVDQATSLDDSGIYLPQSLLVDFDLDVPVPNGQTYGGDFFVSSVVHTSGAVVLTIAYAANGSVYECGITTAFSDSLRNTDTLADRTVNIYPAPNIPDALAGLRGISGRFIIGTCADMAQIGALTFAGASQTGLMPLRIHTRNAGLDSVTVYDGNGAQIWKFTTDFDIKASDGIEFSVDAATNSLIINRVPLSDEDQTAYNSVQDVLDALYTEMGKPICSINGIQPTDDGKFQIQNGDCTSMSTLANGIVISNPCSKPCCDDASASDVRDAMRLLQSSSDRLLAYYESISTNINMLQSRLASLIASRK